MPLRVKNGEGQGKIRLMQGRSKRERLSTWPSAATPSFPILPFLVSSRDFKGGQAWQILKSNNSAAFLLLQYLDLNHHIRASSSIVDF